jgi:hypothetical protein
VAASDQPGRFGFLLLLCCVSALFVAHAETEGFTAVVADVRGVARVYRADGSGPYSASLGKRLRVGDTVETTADASVSIYLSGGQLLEVLGGSRVRITRDLTSDNEKQRYLGTLSARSLKTLEQGVWVLSDPKGSLLVGGLRGAKKTVPRTGSSSPSSGPLLLSPRNELVTDRLPVFYWKGAPGTVHVVVAQRGDAVWRSVGVKAAPLHYPPEAPALTADAEYEWWIEASGTGEALTRPSMFGVASEDTARARLDFERAMDELTQSADGDRITGFLRCAYYAELDAWSELLDIADRLSRHDDTAEFATQAMRHIANHMSLGLEDVALLRKLRAAAEPESPAERG